MIETTLRRCSFLLILPVATLLLAACQPSAPADTFPGVDLNDPEVGGGVGDEFSPISTSAPEPTPMVDRSPRLDAAARATAEANTKDEIRDTSDESGVTSDEPTAEGVAPEEPTAEPTADPSAPEPAATPPADAGEASEIIHVVQPGENLYQIGLIYGLTWQEIADYNGITNPDAIDVGQEIRIPESSEG